MRRKTLAVDAGLAVALTVIALIISPGVAILGMIAILVLAICAVSFARDRRALKSRPTRRTRPSRRQRG